MQAAVDKLQREAGKNMTKVMDAELKASDLEEELGVERSHLAAAQAKLKLETGQRQAKVAELTKELAALRKSSSEPCSRSPAAILSGVRRSVLIELWF